jgi:hypothetical protein
MTRFYGFRSAWSRSAGRWSSSADVRERARQEASNRSARAGIVNSSTDATTPAVIATSSPTLGTLPRVGLLPKSRTATTNATIRVAQVMVPSTLAGIDPPSEEVLPAFIDVFDVVLHDLVWPAPNDPRLGPAAR